MSSGLFCGLARASLEEFRACGLSTRKSEYIHGLARQVVDGSHDLEELRHFSDEEVLSVITKIRTFGRWASECILIRGLGRPDIVPSDDMGIRTIAGLYFGDGDRMAADEVREALEP